MVVDDFVELGEPMEGLVGVEPRIIVDGRIDGAIHLTIKQIVKGIQAGFQIVLGAFEGCHILSLRELYAFEHIVSTSHLVHFFVYFVAELLCREEEIEYKSKKYKANFSFILIFSIVILAVGIGALLAGIIIGNIDLCITAGIVSIVLLMFFVYSLVMYLRIKHAPIEVTVEIEKEQANANPAEGLVAGAVEIVADILNIL